MTDPKAQSSTDVDLVEQSLYAKQKKIYPREVHGVFAALRTTGVMTLLGLYYIIPWLQWDERQMVLFDLPARKFYIFGMVLWPQDFIYLTMMLIVAALTLFFFTALAGRLWCGFACPQTVWTEAFLWIERKVEGDRNRQMKLDKAPWSWRKLRIKTTKQTLWIVFSLFTGLTFVGFFSPIRELTINVLNFSIGPWELFWILFYSFATYGNAGWLREQVCTYMCPYARFQSAMIDNDTLIISYDAARGEFRGGRKKSDDKEKLSLGDCIDCTICVQVCPTGIDIRDGLQYECIGCAACIDACDDVMDKMDYPKGLIRYTTNNILQGGKPKIFRPRIIIYAIILIVLTFSTFYAINTRTPLALDVIRDRNSLYRETNEGLIENVYILKVMNMDKKPHKYTITASGIESMILKIDMKNITVASGKVVEVPARVQVDVESLKSRSSEVIFNIVANDARFLNVSEEARFIGPLLNR